MLQPIGGIRMVEISGTGAGRTEFFQEQVFSVSVGRQIGIGLIAPFHQNPVTFLPKYKPEFYILFQLL